MVFAEPPVGWTLVKPTCPDPKAQRHWHVAAVDLMVRSKRKEFVTASGWTEAEALRDLAGLLKEQSVNQ